MPKCRQDWESRMKRLMVPVFVCAATVLGASGCGDDSVSHNDHPTTSTSVETGTSTPSSISSTAPVPQTPVPPPATITPPPVAEPPIAEPPVAEPPAEEPAPPAPVQTQPAQPEPTLTLPDFDPRAGY